MRVILQRNYFFPVVGIFTFVLDTHEEFEAWSCLLHMMGGGVQDHFHVPTRHQTILSTCRDHPGHFVVVL